MDKIEAMHLFDEGWNKLTERIFANQKRLGVIPPNAKLPEKRSGCPAACGGGNELFDNPTHYSY
ncbi:MAG: hypothetical protein RKO24_05145 [Candidatus Competibacter sp.]|nr:hypothetical protein [Candidatus Competibacter sp.]